MTKASRASVQHEVLVTGSVCRRRGGRWSQAKWLQWRHVSSGPKVPWGSDLWFSRTRAWNGLSSEFLPPTHIRVQIESLSECPHLWFGAFRLLPGVFLLYP